MFQNQKCRGSDVVWLNARVTKIGERKGDRIITYADSDEASELLNIADID